MGDEEKAPKKQEPKVPGKKQMTVLWMAVATALGSQGIPKIVELLENKPDVVQVQEMIAKQTGALTEAQHQMADAVKEGDDRLQHLERSCADYRATTGKLEGRVELLTEVLRDCCTRRRVKGRLNVSPSKKPVVARPDKDPPAPNIGVVVKNLMPDIAEGVMYFIENEDAPDSAMSRVQKVPDFDIQQQVQLQMQEPVE